MALKTTTSMFSQASTGCPTIITVARFCASSVFGHPCWRLVHFSGSSHLRCWPFYSRVIVPTPGTRLTAALFHHAFDTTNQLFVYDTNNMPIFFIYFFFYITPHLHILPPCFFAFFAHLIFYLRSFSPSFSLRGHCHIRLSSSSTRRYAPLCLSREEFTTLFHRRLASSCAH